jgi:hypothetical protein
VLDEFERTFDRPRERVVALERVREETEARLGSEHVLYLHILATVDERQDRCASAERQRASVTHH